MEVQTTKEEESVHGNYNQHRVARPQKDELEWDGTQKSVDYVISKLAAALRQSWAMWSSTLGPLRRSTQRLLGCTLGASRRAS